ncbi:uncharacterized protein LOC134935402 [Pseudophryne corroboree]|uniref:uncharacterized protein LOC134935402 n=1 Tax=Pseudophryne corroboree TaxID=495146 RepID=UPI003081DB94
MGRMEWHLYELCSNVFGHTALSNPVALSSSSDAGTLSAIPSAAATSSPECSQQSEASSQSLFDDDPDVDSDLTVIIDPNKATDVTASSQSTGDDSLPQTQGDKPTLRSNIYTVPPRRKKTTKIEVATKAMTNILCDQLREMDSDWQSQEDARLQKFMDNERELQRNLLTQMVAMQDKISSENREFLGQLFSKMTSAPQFTNTHSDLQSHSHTTFGPKTRYAQQGQSPPSFEPRSQYMQQAQSPTSFGDTRQYMQQAQSPTSFGDTHQFAQQAQSPTTFGDTHQFVQQAQSPTTFGDTHQFAQQGQYPTSFNSTSNTLKNRPRGPEFGDSLSSTTPEESTPSNKPQYQIL